MANLRRIAVMMDIDKPYKKHANVFVGIHDYAREQDNWHLVLDDWADRMLPARLDKPSPYEGLIGRITELGASRARRLGLPVVNVHFNSPAADVPCVFPDYIACGRLRAEHLLARGFRNFGILRHEADRSQALEARGFKQTVLADQSDTGDSDRSPESICSEVVLTSDGETRMGIGALDLSNYRSWKNAMRRIDRWMDRWQLPIGLYVFDMTLSRIVIERSRLRGWRVPEDVAIVAGHNEEIQCERPAPSITSLELPNERVGFEAAHLLDRLIDQADANTRQGLPATDDTEDLTKPILLPPVGIVARQSTDFFAVDDSLVRRALRFIDDHLADRLTIDIVADALNVSRRTLTNRFRETLRCGVAAEIQRLRIERIKRELTATEEPVQLIAAKVGYASPRTMNDAFLSAVGCSPRAYRQQRLQVKANA